MTSRFEDERGVIQDFGAMDAVTWISTVKDAVRGNHYHEHTVQWTLVVSGRLLVASGETKDEVSAGELVFHEAGEPHAWKALEDTICVVFTRGPRAGEDYEKDTIRLSEPLLV